MCAVFPNQTQEMGSKQRSLELARSISISECSRAGSNRLKEKNPGLQCGLGCRGGLAHVRIWASHMSLKFAQTNPLGVLRGNKQELIDFLLKINFDWVGC